MTDVVVLSVVEWLERYPQYSNLSSKQIEDILIDATDYLENSPCSVITDLVKRKRFLYLIAAHLAFITYPDINGDGGSGFVGRIGSATEGSASIASGISNAPYSAEFYMQSQFGYDFWTRTKPYRMGIYQPGPPRRSFRTILGKARGVYE